MQGMEAAAGDWDEILAAEHDLALAIFDKMLATDETQTFKRKMLLMKLTHALDKHAHQEEMVVYPALREANEAVDADQLEGEHGYIKTFIYELNEMGPDSPNWLEKVREFRQLVSRARAHGRRTGLPALQAGTRRGAERAHHEPREPRRLLDGLTISRRERASAAPATERSTLPSPTMRSMRAASSASSAKSRPATTIASPPDGKRHDEAQQAVAAASIRQLARDALGHRRSPAGGPSSAAACAWRDRSAAEAA